MLNFNGVDIPNFVVVKKIDVETLPNISTNLITVGGGVGCIDGLTTFGAKTITATISVVIPKGESLQSCSRELARWVKGNNFKASPLIISNDESIIYMAKISNSISLSDLIFVGEGTLEFVVPTGLAMNVVHKEGNGANSVTLYNGGTFTALPVIRATIEHPVDNGTVLFTHSETGERIVLYGSFITGDEITIDCNKHLVKLNDNMAISMLGLESKFFELLEGDNTITCDNSTNLYVNFQERFL